MNPAEQECKDCKYKKLSMLEMPCKKCQWEGEEIGYPYWEPAEVEN